MMHKSIFWIRPLNVRHLHLDAPIGQSTVMQIVASSSHPPSVCPLAVGHAAQQWDTISWMAIEGWWPRQYHWILDEEWVTESHEWGICVRKKEMAWATTYFLFFVSVCVWVSLPEVAHRSKSLEVLIIAPMRKKCQINMVSGSYQHIHMGAPVVCCSVHLCRNMQTFVRWNCIFSLWNLITNL